MKNTVKQFYMSPSILIFWIELESSIAASSATVSGGRAGDPYTPQVDDWASDEDMGSRVAEF